MPLVPVPIPGPLDPTSATVTAYAPLTYEDDHEGAAVDLLLQQFKGRERIEALLSSYIAQAQDLEDAAWGVLLSMDLDLAQDAQLDGLGDLVGEPRRDRTDDDYRAAIRVRILVNRCTGKHAEILTIIARFLGVEVSTGTVELTEPAPAALKLQVFTVPANAADLRTIARTIKPAGVNLDGRYETSASRPYRFGWSGGAVAGVTGATNGDGWSGDASVGGLHAASI